MQGLLIEEDTTCTGNPADTWKSQLWTSFAWLLEAVSLKHRGNGSDGDSPSVTLASLCFNKLSSDNNMESPASSRTVYHGIHGDGPACFTASYTAGMQLSRWIRLL